TNDIPLYWKLKPSDGGDFVTFGIEKSQRFALSPQIEPSHEGDSFFTISESRHCENKKDRCEDN
ncbi:hypothetical protein DK293_17085, partial [Vibrio cholerae]|nr:hypothetical protein [Vibrio cholerae]